MNFTLLRLAPALIVGTMCAITVLVEWLASSPGRLPLLERLEWVTYDWRVRQALWLRPATTERIGVMYVDDESLAQFEQRLGLPWPVPRWLHGVMLEEITAQRAAATGYDIFFTRPRPEEFAPSKQPGVKVPSDVFFAQAMKRNGGVFLGAPPNSLKEEIGVVKPAAVFADAAAGFGDARKQPDADGVFRRLSPVINDPTNGKVWQLGFLMAARQRGWQLDQAVLTPWQLIVPDAAGRRQVIPLDGQGNFIIPWTLPAMEKSRLAARSMLEVLGASSRRRNSKEAPKPWWQGRLVFVGSFGNSPVLADSGPTPVGQRTPFCSTHWNVAAAVLENRYIRIPALIWRVFPAWILVVATGWMSWRLRAVWATVAVVLLAAAYLAFGTWALAVKGWWLPVALPLLCAIGVTHGLMAFFRMVIERAHRRRLRSVFEHVLSPQLLDLVLAQPRISWAPQEKEMTVFFADIRGFTALTDIVSTEDRGLTPVTSPPSPGAGGKSHDQEVLEVVNLYLGIVAETIKENGATLDKYMGDCVMAFWGAPVDQPDHATAAVRAAVQVQQRLHALNVERQQQNERIQAENEANPAAPPKALLPILTLGTGINTGRMTVGFMGSPELPSNYTVFGREVNIASRLEALSGSSRILVTKAVVSALVNSFPAGRITPIGPVIMKGVSEPVEAFEIDWQAESLEKIDRRE